MESIKQHIDLEKLPNHIAIIMDGNGRWAKSQGKPRIFGHKSGVTAVREVTEACAEIGIKYLTLYAFSTENWNRPAFEVNALMALLVEAVENELKTLNKNQIRLNAIGDLGKLPSMSQKALMRGIESTKNNTRMTLNLALNYSSRWEIVNATKHIAEDIKENKIKPEDVTEQLFSSYLSTKEFSGFDDEVNYNKDFRYANILVEKLGDYNMNLTYKTDSDSGSGTSVQVNLNPGGSLWGTMTWGTDLWGGGVTQEDKRVYLGTLRGKRIQFKFSNQNAVNQRFKVHGLNFAYNIKGYR